ncbi:MAG: hypothetical protein VYB80_01420, partial [Actinomycetota bacterium]|nr:hypothetical protein [Actinomycetota bacterium]
MAEEIVNDENSSVEEEPDTDASTGETMYDVPISRSRGQVVLHPTREQYTDTISKLLEDGFRVCIDITAVDYLENPERNVPSS